jgi:hypothetical protein
MAAWVSGLEITLRVTGDDGSGHGRGSFRACGGLLAAASGFSQPPRLIMPKP